MSVPTFAELGFFHILDVSAWDHLLFVAALIAPFAPRDFKLWLAALTAFTLGHTMAMAGQVAAKVPLNERLVEGGRAGYSDFYSRTRSVVQRRAKNEPSRVAWA